MYLFYLNNGEDTFACTFPSLMNYDVQPCVK